MSNYICISKDDIKKAEKILLPAGCLFDEDEIVPIIQCMDKSIDVIACPGSGKTTALLAKLTLILDSLPLDDGKGICVMTHTNVAVNEIKEKLGSKSDILFQYPNYFGTIHSFYSKFCATPYYKQIYESNIAVVDDDLYYRVLRSKFIPWSDLWKKISYQVKDEIDKIDSGLGKSEKLRLQTNIKFGYLKGVRLTYDGNFFFSKSGKTIVKDKKKDLYKAYYKLLHDEMLAKGVLKYSDVYLLSQMYLTTFPEIRNYLSSRFKYVFIDETQDNSSLQNEVVNLAFNDDVILQRFGDANQAIYDSSNVSDGDMQIKGEKLEITKSMRFNQPIADFISSMRTCESDKPLIAVDGAKGFVPHLILYNEDTIGSVIDKYISIINEYQLSDAKYLFKACGWVGFKEAPEHLTVNSYYPDFSSKKKVEKKHSNLNFIGILNETLKHRKSAGNVYKGIIEFCVKFLNSIDFEVEGSRVNSKSLKKTVENKFEEDLIKLRTSVTPWTRRILNNDVDVYSEIGQFLFGCISKVIEEEIFDESDFLKHFKVDGIELNFNESCENRISKDGVSISIDTVHGVKGETHIATLYLESLYHKKTDLNRIFTRMFGKKKGKFDAYERSSLRIGYVGMSRATDLLCIAVSESTFSEFERDLLRLEQDESIKLIKLY